MALNGRFPDALLAYLGWPEADHLRLVPAAAASITRLAAAFEIAFSKSLYLSDAYRTYAQQVSLKIVKGVFAATPGTSNHGLGLAIDVASRINVDGSAEHRWMEANGPVYGWINPAWAVDYNPANGQHEPWHWEYRLALDTHPTPAQEDDMTPEQDNLLRHIVAMVGEVPIRVWKHPIVGTDDVGVEAWAWLRDTRIIVGQLTSSGGTSAISTADLARIATAVADEQARRQVS